MRHDSRDDGGAAMPIQQTSAANDKRRTDLAEADFAS
jgi:hypothetical protein